jgi:hypothetical protein
VKSHPGSAELSAFHRGHDLAAVIALPGRFHDAYVGVRDYRCARSANLKALASAGGGKLEPAAVFSDASGGSTKQNNIGFHA